MEITVVTSTWSDTKKIEKELHFAVKELGLRASIAFVMGERSREACIAHAPAIIVDGKALCENGIPDSDELKGLFRKYLGSNAEQRA
ncbi:TPA: hypothetical protein EYP38_05220 [Candidatus Micrarchaeota archaeon]|nr:hypothetical protein [Candidatus Micrarchaeota archaeon]